MGVKRIAIIQQALKKGIILIPLGTTNAYIAVELTGLLVKRSIIGNMLWVLFMGERTLFQGKSDYL